jgi:hypothetical protein
MERVKHQEGLDSTPAPAAYFDLIGGTSTGEYILPSMKNRGVNTSYKITGSLLSSLVVSAILSRKQSNATEH